AGASIGELIAAAHRGLAEPCKRKLPGETNSRAEVIHVVPVDSFVGIRTVGSDKLHSCVHGRIAIGGGNPNDSAGDARLAFQQTARPVAAEISIARGEKPFVEGIRRSEDAASNAEKSEALARRRRRKA